MSRIVKEIALGIEWVDSEIQVRKLDFYYKKNKGRLNRHAILELESGNKVLNIELNETQLKKLYVWAMDLNKRIKI